MPRLFDSTKETVAAAGKANAAILISGGHGGLVTYDGEGGQMVKEGGPMDRLFLMVNDGRILGDAGLDIEYGHINFHTGKLEQEVEITKSEDGDDLVHFYFDSNESDQAIEVKGGLREVGLHRDTVLVSGNAARSTMIWETGSKTGTEPSLPYVAFHPNLRIHPDILEWYGIPHAQVVGGDTGWGKLAPSSMKYSAGELGRSGKGFRTQQHLGHLRVLLSI